MKPSRNELKQLVRSNPVEIREIIHNLKWEEGIASVAIEVIMDEKLSVFYLPDLIRALDNSHPMVQECALYAIERALDEVVETLKVQRADKSRDAWMSDAIDEVLENVKENFEE